MSDAATAPATQAPAAISSDDETRKHLLIAEICIYRDRIAALSALMDERKAALRLLMKAGGDRKRTTDLGTATFYTQATFEVHDRKQLAKMFSKETLVEAFKPYSDFVKAAQKQKLPIEKAVTIGADERFKVERPRTERAREMQDSVIEETKRETEARVERLARIMVTDRQRLNKGGTE